MILCLIVLLVTYNLSATITEKSAEQTHAASQIFVGNPEELAPHIPLQTLYMARPLIQARVDYLTTLSVDDLVAQSSEEELILYKKSLQIKKHDAAERKRMECPELMFGSLSIASFLVGCVGLAHANALVAAGSAACCIMWNACGAAFHEEPDHTEINAKIQKADAAYIKKYSLREALEQFSN